MDPDLSAIQRLQTGDEQALVELMTCHKEAIFRLAWRYTRNEQDAAEIAEETFVRAYFKAGSFRPKAKVKTWLFTIAANLCKDLIRRQKKERKHVSMDAPLNPNDSRDYKDTLSNKEADARESAESRERMDTIDEAILALPHKLKFPFVFCSIEGNSYDECAIVLKTSRKTVETRIYRARLRLRQQLASIR